MEDETIHKILTARPIMGWRPPASFSERFINGTGTVYMWHKVYIGSLHFRTSGKVTFWAAPVEIHHLDGRDFLERQINIETGENLIFSIPFDEINSIEIMSYEQKYGHSASKIEFIIDRKSGASTQESAFIMGVSKLNRISYFDLSKWYELVIVGRAAQRLTIAACYTDKTQEYQLLLETQAKVVAAFLTSKGSWPRPPSAPPTSGVSTSASGGVGFDL